MVCIPSVIIQGVRMYPFIHYTECPHCVCSVSPYTECPHGGVLRETYAPIGCGKKTIPTLSWQYYVCNCSHHKSALVFVM
jgi:hypothetical protein